MTRPVSLLDAEHARHARWAIHATRLMSPNETPYTWLFRLFLKLCACVVRGGTGTGSGRGSAPSNRPLIRAAKVRVKCGKAAG